MKNYQICKNYIFKKKKKKEIFRNKFRNIRLKLKNCKIIIMNIYSISKINLRNNRKKKGKNLNKFYNKKKIKYIF